jgi:hypothetical protein
VPLKQAAKQAAARAPQARLAQPRPAPPKPARKVANANAGAAPDGDWEEF